DVTLAGLSDVAQQGPRSRRSRLERRVDAGIIEKSRPAGRVGLRRNEEILPASSVKGAFRFGVWERFEKSQRRRDARWQKPLRARRTVRVFTGRRERVGKWIVAPGKGDQAERAQDE